MRTENLNDAEGSPATAGMDRFEFFVPPIGENLARHLINQMPGLVTRNGFKLVIAKPA